MDVDTVQLRDLLSPSLQDEMYRRYQMVQEESSRISDINGVQELRIGSIHAHNVRYERVIRLTFGHYLCIDQSTCYLYYYDDFREDMKLLSRFTVKGKMTPDKVMLSFAESNREEFSKLSEIFYKETLGDRYISHYRCFNALFSADIVLTVATLSVLIDNNFNKTYLDVVGALTGKYPEQMRSSPPTRKPGKS